MGLPSPVCHVILCVKFRMLYCESGYVDAINSHSNSPRELHVNSNSGINYCFIFNEKYI